MNLSFTDSLSSTICPHQGLRRVFSHYTGFRHPVLDSKMNNQAIIDRLFSTLCVPITHDQEGVEKRSKKKNLNDGKEKYKEKYYERVKRFSLIPYVCAPSPLASALFIIKRFPYRNSKNFSPKVSWSFRL